MTDEEALALRTGDSVIVIRSGRPSEVGAKKIVRNISSVYGSISICTGGNTDYYPPDHVALPDTAEAVLAQVIGQ